ncbi:MAG: hypothetical protein AAGK97_03555 [Bacteroidota bacterium]
MNQHIKSNLPQKIALLNLGDSLGIEKLQAKISTLYGLEKSEDIDLLTTLFVKYLADNLELIQKPAEIGNSNIVDLTCFPSLPNDFPKNADIPIYLYGDKVYVGREAIEDYAIVIGRFYAFDYINEQWQWKYLILDNADYTTNSFFSTRIYWETELKPSD